MVAPVAKKNSNHQPVTNHSAKKNVDEQQLFLSLLFLELLVWKQKYIYIYTYSFPIVYIYIIDSPVMVDFPWGK